MIERGISSEEGDFRMLIGYDTIPSYSVSEKTREKYAKIAMIRDQVMKAYSSSERAEMNQIIGLKEEEFIPFSTVIENWDIDDFTRAVHAAYSRILSIQESFVSVPQLSGSKAPVTTRSFRFTAAWHLNLRTYIDGRHAVWGIQ